MNITHKQYRFDALLVASLAALLFATTLYTGVGGRFNFGDSAKWQYLWIINGAPHSTGYPLFLMLTELFGNTLTFLWLPIRITLISTVFALVSVVYLHKLIALITQNRFAATTGALLLCTSFTFWVHATEPEVYTLNLAFHLATSYYLLLAIRTRQMRWFYLACFLYALSFGNHLLMITLLPSIVFLTATSMPQIYRQPKVLLAVAAFIAIGAGQYYYLWHIAQHQSPWLEFVGYRPTFTRFLDYITGGEFRGSFQSHPSLTLLKKFFRYEIKKELNLLVLLMTPLSIWAFYRYAAKPQKNAVIFILLQLITLGTFCLFYAIPDIETYYLPLTAMIILLFSLPLRNRKHAIARNTVMIASIIYGFAHNYPDIANPSTSFGTRVEALRKALPDKAVVFSARGVSTGPYSGLQGHSVWNYGNLDEKFINFLFQPKDINAANTFYFLEEDKRLVERTGNFVIEQTQPVTRLSELLLQAPAEGTARLLVAYKPEPPVIKTLQHLFSSEADIIALTPRHSMAALIITGENPVIAADSKESSIIHRSVAGVELAAVSLSARSGSRWRKHDGYYQVNNVLTPLHCGGLSIIDIHLQDASLVHYHCFQGDRLDSLSIPPLLFKATRK